MNLTGADYVIHVDPWWNPAVELAQSVSIAMLMVLETLSPTQRAVFVLREVFDTPYEEIARPSTAGRARR